MSEVFQPVRDVSGSPASATGAIATSPTATALSLGPGGAPRADSGPSPAASARRRYWAGPPAPGLRAGGAPLGPAAARAASGPFPDASARRRYWIVLTALVLMAGGFALGLLAVGNPMPVGSRGFWLIAEMRVTSLVVMGVAAFCQATATIAFQTVT